MRTPADTVVELIEVLRFRLSHRRRYHSCRTALAMWYLGGGSNVDICEVFCVHATTLYQSVCRKTSLCQRRPQPFGRNVRGCGWLVNRWKGCCWR